MALLESTTIPHPALEALFTIDEETGMTGALALKGGLLDGSIMLNLDTEDDDELTIGCAGGVDITATGTYTSEATKHNMAYKISVKGLTGGHSGMDIHRGRGNANKIMNRLLLNLTRDLTIEIASIDGGSLRNAIPRESVSVITVGDANNLKKSIQEFESIIQAEYKTTDPHVVITIEETDIPTQVVSADFQYKLLRSIYACPFGIYRMSSDIAGLVQTSNNVARVIVKDGAFQIQCLTRSSVDTEKLDLQHAITSAFELMGANIVAAGSYPGWTPKPSAPIVKLMSDLYKERYHSEAKVSACHAGLECGILGTNYPDMQMISFGPNIKGAHSPDERAQISSVQKYWGFLLETLVRIPKK
jgi:dipeptidase D